MLIYAAIFDKPQWWHKFYAWPEGITATAIIATLIAITWQAYETRKSVNAANRGMEIGKTKERAKLMLTLEPIAPRVNSIPESKFTVTNVGESTAFFGIAIAGLHISDSEEITNDGSGYYELKIIDGMLKSGEFSNETAWWTGHPLHRYTATMLDEKHFIHLHGSIVFRDNFEDVWNRKFHYIWRNFGSDIWFPNLQKSLSGQWESRLEERDQPMRKGLSNWGRLRLRAKKVFQWMRKLSDDES